MRGNNRYVCIHAYICVHMYICMHFWREWWHLCRTAILRIIEGQFQVFQRFSNCKLVLQIFEKLFRGPQISVLVQAS